MFIPEIKNASFKVFIMNKNKLFKPVPPVLVLFILLVVFCFPVYSQQWIKNMPGYDQYKKMSPEIRSSVKLGRLTVTWIKEGNALEFNKDGKRFRYDIARKKTTEIGEAGLEESPYMRYRRMGGPARGRQYETADSPDGNFKAFYRNRNLYLTDKDGNN